MLPAASYEICINRKEGEGTTIALIRRDAKGQFIGASAPEEVDNIRMLAMISNVFKTAYTAFPKGDEYLVSLIGAVAAIFGGTLRLTQGAICNVFCGRHCYYGKIRMFFVYGELQKFLEVPADQQPSLANRVIFTVDRRGENLRGGKAGYISVFHE